MLFIDRSLIIFYVSKICFDGGTSNKLTVVEEWEGGGVDGWDNIVLKLQENS